MAFPSACFALLFYTFTFQSFNCSAMLKAINDWKFVLLACLTLGLAPFSPQPHIISKLIWILDGAKGQYWLDWVDFGMHALPWLLLLRLGIVYFLRQFKKEQTSDM
jgi:hypothetical protein